MKNKRYALEYTNKFRRQYKKISKNSNFKKEELEKVLNYLINNEKIPEKYHNHLLNPKSLRNLGMPYSARCFIRISKAER